LLTALLLQGLSVKPKKGDATIFWSIRPGEGMVLCCARHGLLLRWCIICVTTSELYAGCLQAQAAEHLLLAQYQHTKSSNSMLLLLLLQMARLTTSHFMAAAL
jgi:hypothetical protein